MAPAAQQASMPLLVVLESIIEKGNLGVLDLQCLGRCSKACSSAAAAALANCAASLLPAAVKQAAATEQASNLPTRKEVRAVRLLLRKESRKPASAFLSLPTAAPLFLSISNVPKVVATKLLKAGLRFSFVQLMQAAQAHTAGVHVWLQAIADLKPAVKKALQEGLPPWVETLFCTPEALVSATQNIFCTSAASPQPHEPNLATTSA
jgi:hypothetical protein